MAGAPLVAGLIAVASLGGAGAVAGAVAVATTQRLAHSADAAALAAADVLLGWAPGSPCEVAERLVVENGGELSLCEVEGLTVRVTVSGRLLGATVDRLARAGPP